MRYCCREHSSELMQVGTASLCAGRRRPRPARRRPFAKKTRAIVEWTCTRAVRGPAQAQGSVPTIRTLSLSRCISTSEAAAEQGLRHWRRRGRVSAGKPARKSPRPARGGNTPSCQPF
ncbi:hypothetical protein VTN96DRAFT_5436 [Rasamsonia emersonii]